MASGYKTPPSFGDGETSYEAWKQELEMWELVTDLKKEKQAIAIVLNLKGQAKAIALEIEKTLLNAVDGIRNLLNVLDPIFQRNETDILYSLFKQFESFERGDKSISEYIIDFERIYNLLKNKEMALPEAVLAFKLLEKAGLDTKEKQLALTACNIINFESMKSALRRIFGQSNNSDFDGAIKQEVFYNKYQRNNRNKTSFVKNSYNNSVQKGTNPLDRQGRRTKCAVCSSTFHWVKDCPHKDVKFVEEENLDDCMYTQQSQKHSYVFMTESFGAAILDTACTSTVCGTKWLFDYIESLSSEEKTQISEKNSDRIFRFGDGSKVKAMKTVVIPATIEDKQCQISTDVVDLELPLLLSKASLKKANAVIDLENDKVTMFGQNVKLQQTSSGHYCVDLRNDKQTEDSEVLVVLEEMDTKDKETAVKKLHRQFGHASEQKLGDLLKKANVQDKEIYDVLTKVTNDCELCAKFKKTPSRPAVSLPLASDFNELISVDLHQLEQSVWYLHIIDIFTRFSAGCIVRTKDASVIGDKIIKNWIGIFGPPKKLFSDNGGEFANEHITQLAQQFNIELMTTAAYAPWSNGICERHNMTLTEIIKKVKVEMKCDYEVALSWALMSKNMLSNVHGYSSYQLVYGKNPILPSIFTDQLPALSGKTTSQMVGNHISALYATRKAFTEVECSERIRRALRKQTRTNMDEIYRNGDKVFYKRPGEDEWRGPSKVIGQDGVIVFVRHGSQLVRVHVCRLKKIQREVDTNNTKGEKSVCDEHVNKSDGSKPEVEHEHNKNYEENDKTEIQIEHEHTEDSEENDITEIQIEHEHTADR